MLFIKNKQVTNFQKDIGKLYINELEKVIYIESSQIEAERQKLEKKINTLEQDLNNLRQNLTKREKNLIKLK